MSVWIPMFAMPNVQPQNVIEIEGVAFVSVHDQRIKDLRSQYSNYDAYLNKFSDEFGIKLNPSTIMIRDDTPAIYRRVDALGSFRDAISIASISKTWANVLRYGPHMDGPRYSNTFTFYPWLLDKNYDKVATQSIATIGVQEVASMRAQSVAAFSFCHLLPRMMDGALLAELLKRWARRYATDKPHWKDRALFRSLNMANAAANLPAHAEITVYDLGRLVGLWVSAFEILAHPPYGKQNGFKQVYSLLASTEWRNSWCIEKRYIPYPHKRNTSRSNLPCWIYGQLNGYRNDFLHGNRVTDDHLVTKRSRRAIQSYASVLYRMALASYTGLKWKEKLPKNASSSQRANYEEQQFEFDAHQRDAEAALGSICYTAAEWNDLTHGQLSPDVKKWP